jgi:hypothetical protein
MQWLMKVTDDLYREWSTNTDSWLTAPLTRAEAIAYSDEQGLNGEERVSWTDAHLCSSKARLGESYIRRGGKLVAVGGGKLAYHFDRYEDVARYCRSQAQMREDEVEDHARGAYRSQAADASAPWIELDEWKRESWRCEVDDTRDVDRIRQAATAVRPDGDAP